MDMFLFAVVCRLISGFGEEGGWAAGRVDTACINAIITIKIINCL